MGTLHCVCECLVFVLFVARTVGSACKDKTQNEIQQNEIIKHKQTKKEGEGQSKDRVEELSARTDKAPLAHTTC